MTEFGINFHRKTAPYGYMLGVYLFIILPSTSLLAITGAVFSRYRPNIFDTTLLDEITKLIQVPFH